MSSSVVIGLDLGTTSAKAIALTAGGEIRAESVCTYPIYTPQPGWVEQDPWEIWQAAQFVLKTIFAQIPAQEVQAVALSGAMHNLFPVDRTINPLAHAMTWADSRAGALVNSLRSQADTQALYNRVGCPLRHIYHPVRLAWWHQNASRLSATIHQFLSLKEWVIYHLTGELACDTGWASTTGLLNQYTLNWDEEALELCQTSPKHLPLLVKSSSRVQTQNNLPGGIPAGIPIFFGSSDGALANLGAGATEPGQIVITVGTSGAIRRICAEPSQDPGERTWCYTLDESTWFAGGAINNAGLALGWVRERFYPELTPEQGYHQIMADAAQVYRQGTPVLALPYLTGERSPHWQPDIRASITNLGFEHTRAHIALAILESVAFCLKQIWDILIPNNEPIPSAHLTGSITASPTWQQILADSLQTTLIPIDIADSSAIGAAIFAHKVLGNIHQYSDLSSKIHRGKTLQPDVSRRDYLQQKYLQFAAMYQALYEDLA